MSVTGVLLSDTCWTDFKKLATQSRTVDVSVFQIDDDYLGLKSVSFTVDSAGTIQPRSITITVLWSFLNPLPIVVKKSSPQLNLSVGCRASTCDTTQVYFHKRGSQNRTWNEKHFSCHSLPFFNSSEHSHDVLEKVPEFIEKHKDTESLLVESVCRKYRVSPPSGWYKTSWQILRPAAADRAFESVEDPVSSRCPVGVQLYQSQSHRQVICLICTVCTLSCI